MKNPEYRFFVYALRLGIAFEVYQNISAIIYLGFHLTTYFNLVLILSLMLLYYKRSPDKLQIQAFTLHMIIFISFSYFWIEYGGMYGTVPCFLSLYMAFIIVVSRNLYLAFSIGLFTAGFGTFLFVPGWLPFTFSGPEQIKPVFRDIDFVAVGLIFIYFFVLLKNEYRFFRKQLGRKNKQLKRLVETLSYQNAELESQQAKIEMINNNLESIVSEHTRKIQEKNKELSEYAFINAHLVRAPLCRIMGLVNLIEMEHGQQASRSDLQDIAQIAGEIDLIVRKINEKLN